MGCWLCLVYKPNLLAERPEHARAESTPVHSKVLRCHCALSEKQSCLTGSQRAAPAVLPVRYFLGVSAAAAAGRPQRHGGGMHPVLILPCTCAMPCVHVRKLSPVTHVSGFQQLPALTYLGDVDVLLSFLVNTEPVSALYELRMSFRLERCLQ